MQSTFQILPTDLLEAFLSKVLPGLRGAFDALQEADLSSDTFSFYTSVASVFSSKIEGEDIDLDSYIKHRKFGTAFQPDYTRKIDDLYESYTYAHSHALNAEHMSTAHQILSRHLLASHLQGVLRTQIMYVATPEGRIEYVAADPSEVGSAMKKLYADIATLLDQDLSFVETFFYASLMHLVFVKIHPWSDGNGRSARLLEKWFLAEKLGRKSWFIQSEKYYYAHHQSYYQNIRMLGLEYSTLNYAKGLPFLLMLPNSVIV